MGATAHRFEPYGAEHQVAIVLFLWGVVLTTQAMLTPDLAAPFPEPRFLAFWLMHWLVVWAGLFLVLGLGIRPRWRDYAITVAATLGWAALTAIANALLGTNYGYLNAKPAGGSLLDLLGPWPYYLAAEAAIIAGVWALMVWLLRGPPLYDATNPGRSAATRGDRRR